MGCFQKTLIVISFFFWTVKLHAQENKYTFDIQVQYSSYVNEFSDKPEAKIVYLCNNDNNNYLKFIIINDTVQNISLSDKKLYRVYSSREKFILDSNLQERISSLKFDLFQFKFPEKENENIQISVNHSKTEKTINIREYNDVKKKRKGIKNDLYLKTIKNPKFINTQNFSIGMITHHRIWHAKPINDEVILESHYLKENIKTDLYKLDNIETVNFEIIIKTLD